MNVIGLDLAGSKRKTTGFCLLKGKGITVESLKENIEILDKIREIKPVIVAMDAPLTLPKGRKSIHKNNGIHFRECDRELRRRGIRFFPITLGPMRMLTERGMKLKTKIEKLGIKVIEVYPGAALDIFGIKRKDRESAVEWIEQKGYSLNKRELNQDEVDSIFCAVAGFLYLKKKAEILGKEDGEIVVPKSE